MKSVRKEGFWYEGSGSSLPKPIALTEPWKNKSKFLKALSGLESRVREHGRIRRYKGGSICRICECRNGSTEFEFKGWTWPVGFEHYVEAHNVQPSLAFQKFVLGV